MRGQMSAKTKGHSVKHLTEMIPGAVLRDKNPSGNTEKEMKQEFAALFKAFGGRGDISGERRLRAKRMKLLYQRGLKES